MNTKSCNKCGELKPATPGFFHRNSACRDGLFYWCKDCTNRKRIAWQSKNLPRQGVANKRYRDKIRIEVVDHYSDGTNSCAQCGERTPEFLSIDHIDGGGSSHRRRLAASGIGLYGWLKKTGFPGGYRVLCHDCNCSNAFFPESYDPPNNVAANSRNYRARLKAMALAAYGGERPACDCCGEFRVHLLTFDHINNDGRKHRTEIGHGGHQLVLWLKRNGYPPGIRLLCYNCNLARGYYGKCPHEIGIR